MYMFSSVHHPLLYESVSESAVLRLPPHSLAKTTVSTRMYPEEVDRQDTFPRFVVKVLKSTSGCRSCFSRFGCRRSNCRSWDRSRGYRKSSKAYTRCRGKRVKSGGDTTQPSVEATAFSLILSSLLTVGLLHGGKSPFSTKPNFHRLQQCCQCQPLKPPSSMSAHRWASNDALQPTETTTRRASCFTDGPPEANRSASPMRRRS